jgi:hypothetical protein
MMRKLVLLLGLCAPAWWCAAQAQTGPTAAAAPTLQAPAAAASSAIAPSGLPDLKMPSLTDLSVMVPRPVKAVTAALGMGRQRLALVVGLGTVGAKQVLDSAPRDTQAVAVTLRNAGYVVMVREDVSADDLRASLREFHDRLQPGGVGFIYVTALGAQVEGQNLLLPRDMTLDDALAPELLAAQLRRAALPVSELVDALIGTPDSPRMLVVDAAYRHPVLARLPLSGLAEQKLPLGTMALFGHALGALHEVPAVGALPDPAPTDPAEIAASRFARVLVASLAKPRVKGPDALRQVRKTLAENYPGEGEPWIGGDTDNKEDFAEAQILDSLVPRTPEEWAREALRQGGRYLTKSSGSEAEPAAQAVSDANTAPPSPTSETPPGQKARAPEAPGSSLGSQLGSALSTAETVAGVAGTAAAVAAGVRATETAAAVSASTTALNVARSVASNVISLGARLAGSGGTSEQTVQQSVQQSVRQAAAVQAAPSSVPGATVTPEAGVRQTVAENLGATASPPGAAVTAAPTPPAASPPVVPATPVPATPVPATPVPALPAVPPTLPAAPPAANVPVASAPGDLPVSSFAPVAGAAGAVGAAAAAAGSGNAQRLARAAAGNAADQLLAPDERTRRNPGGGERPNYVPRANPFGYAEGDTYTYRVIDAWKDEVTRQYTTAIDQVLDNGRLLANGQLTQMDAQGRLIREARADGSFSEFTPSQDLWWSNPKRGESHATRFVEKFQRADRVNGQTEWKGSTSVGRPRKIELPAGEFEVLPIETSGWYYETLANGGFSSGKFSRTVWYSPKLGHPVAIDIEDADRLGTLVKRERVELVHAQVARVAPAP